MRVLDVLRMSWGQIVRRKVVTLLCMIGLSIGCAAMIIALSVGQSVQVYGEKTLNENYKMDEIAVSPNEGIGSSGSNGQTSTFERGALTARKIDIISSLPHVVAVAPMLKLDMLEMATLDGKSSNVEVIGTELGSLSRFGYRFDKGGASGISGAAIVNYGATFGLVDAEVIRELNNKLMEDSFNEEFLQQYMALMSTQTELFQAQFNLKYQDMNDSSKAKASSPLRVTGVLKVPGGMSENNAMYDKKVYVSLETARMLAEQFQSSQAQAAAAGRLNSALVKVEDKKYVAQVQEQIQKLTLMTDSNLYQEQAMKEQLGMYQKAAMGIGIFVMLLASLSIIVAMIMSTHQRRKQIGVMKVLGANLWQIRQMFITEAAVLGVLGGIVGVFIAYGAIQGVNGLLQGQISMEASTPLQVVIETSALPAGIAFAVLTGVLSGIYPAISASRTNALQVIKSA
ncbi:FtsX-like permease family protein [Paenibacillus marchantiae]|uniref:ABC transporter permease n=1 Tax=Paenibacillus marchantiae TaxID=3026433 RepID=UPI00237B91EC|nr:FtsX-like permease family protein [Paenibacillus marchantiae]WDQ34610.1 FtsX-like permease family protein [Paenibacillus marchantiae]